MNNNGLVGNNISYSLSPKLHKIIAQYFNIDMDYKLYDIDEENLKVLLEAYSMDGFNVTKPYKKVVYNLVDDKDELAIKIGAINTVVIKDNLLFGYNTDYYGLLELFKYYDINLNNKRVLILGTGGAALASYYAALNFTKDIIFVSRDKSLKQMPSVVINYNEIKIFQYDVIINATPIGTYPNINDSPITSDLVNNQIVIDLIYNPNTTKLMSYSSNHYNGIVMLIAQAIYSQRIWTGQELIIDKETIRQIKELLINE